jgi:hypothetical protein
MLNGWDATGGSAFYTVRGGFVWVELRNITKGTPDTTTMFTLPLGARPNATREIQHNNGTTVVRVATNGNVSQPTNFITGLWATLIFPVL